MINRKDINELTAALERIKGQWSGEGSKGDEDRSNAAGEALELIGELEPVLEELEIINRKCPACEGEGETAVYDRVEPGAPLYHADNKPCEHCGGTGEITY